MQGDILVIFLSGIVLILGGIMIFMYFHFRRKSSRFEAEYRKQHENLEVMVRERTRNLESVRDSLSQYAVQKFELAQELELKNQQISQQKDDLFKQSERLSEAYEEIKKLDAFKQQMARMLIHDLKNPLNIIMNIVEDQNISPDSRVTIRRLSWEMLDLIMNILEVTRLETSKMKIFPVSYDLSSTMVSLHEKYSFLLLDSGVVMKDELPSPCVVVADKKLIERVIDNLLSNAIKYTPSGGLIILRASDIMEDSAYIRIEVSDSGYGVPEKILKDIFTEYTHGNSKTFSYNNPTGIGLAYCKLAVEANGGKIGILSTEGGGTTVWFTLLKGDQSVLFSPDNVMKMSPHQEPGLLEEDITLAGTLVTRLKAVGIFEISIILKILNNDIFEFNDRLRTWRDEMKKSVYTGNNNRYNSLLSLFEASKPNH